MREGDTMAGIDEALLDRLARAVAWRGSRRHAGSMAAALLTALAAPAATSGRDKPRHRRKDRADEVPTPVGRRFCGGIAGIPCPKGFLCIDNRNDQCDPAHGGADCGGICVRKKKKNPCARIRCAAGTVCCPRCGGMCISSDVPCGAILCEPEPCGKTVCQPGEYCCSERCSQCAPIGKRCRDDLCLPDPSNTCGDTVCGPGEFCCNPSCGECAPIAGACTAHYCPPSEGQPCGRRVCPQGQICCNASCGICTKPGGVCPAIACLPVASIG